MKKLILTISALALLTLSCKDIHVKTVLNTDGSLIRSYEMSQSSSNNPEKDSAENEIPILPHDITWDKITTIDSANDKQILTYSKTFMNAGELQKTYKTHQYTLKPTQPVISYQSHYNGIKSTYTFKEAFKGIFPCKNPHEVFTPEEIASIKENNYQENKDLENKFDLWVAYGYIALVKQTIDSLSNENLNLDVWETEIKLTINEIIVDKHKDASTIEQKNKDIPDFTNLEYLTKTIEESIGKKIDESTQQKLEIILEEHLEAYSALLINNLVFSIQFNGELIKTNADSISGNTAYWKASPLMTGNELIMELEAGTMNYNIFIVIIIAIILIMLRRKWKK